MVFTEKGKKVFWISLVVDLILNVLLLKINKVDITLWALSSSIVFAFVVSIIFSLFDRGTKK